MRKALPQCRGWTDFVDDWQPRDLILVTRKAPRDQAQKLLFERHKEAFPDEPVPLLYRPRDTRLQNVLVTIPGPLLVDDGQQDQQELVLNDVVEVSVETAQEVLDGKWGQNWALGYAMTVHSSQGLTIKDPQKNIGRKLQAYKRVDAAKGLKCNLRLRIKDVEALKEKQSNRCASCNIDLLWCYEPKDTRQFSVDRIDNAKGHTRDNVRLACLECNRKRGAAALTHCEATKNDGVPPGNVSAGQLRDLFDSI
ncbi:hypothetical protein RRG08_023023 [Elysia crispata]|uniref:HNH nuclease domain-containing protein n=1 Tax=Elysia crispata TaxID=231223 RepID=A0AAE0XWL3_9GAST|nr:hypothetical protein RRG08_023023 [Elysia crispata]